MRLLTKENQKGMNESYYRITNRINSAIGMLDTFRRVTDGKLSECQTNVLLGINMRLIDALDELKAVQIRI